MKLSQGAAVYAAVIQVLGTIEGNVGEALTKVQRTEVNQIVCGFFRDGTTGFRPSEANDAKLRDDSKLGAYVSGLVSNWIRKDKRLNGGVQYVAKSTGNRGDATLKNLRLLLGNYEVDTEEHQAVAEAIEAREAELATSRAKQVTPDMSKIPADLKATLGIE